MYEHVYLDDDHRSITAHLYDPVVGVITIYFAGRRLINRPRPGCGGYLSCTCERTIDLSIWRSRRPLRALAPNFLAELGGIMGVFLWVLCGNRDRGYGANDNAGS